MTKFIRKTIPTVDALVAAIAAYQLNDQTVVRNSTESQTSNKLLVYNFFAEERTFEQCDSKDLQQRAYEIRAKLGQRISIAALTGKRLPGFLLSVEKLVSAETVTTSSLGTLVWAPKLADDLDQQDDQHQRQLHLGFFSNWVGVVGKKTELTFRREIIRYSQQYNSYFHSGIDEQDNLINFFSTKVIEDGTRITARVKDHARSSQLNNAKVTRLHYVKVAK